MFASISFFIDMVLSLVADAGGSVVLLFCLVVSVYLCFVQTEAIHDQCSKYISR